MPENQVSGGQSTRILDEATYQDLLGEKKSKQKRRSSFTKASLRSVFGIILLVGYLGIIGFIVVADVFLQWATKCIGSLDASRNVAQLSA